MYDAVPCVRVVDDDASVLKSLDRLLRSAGFTVRTFPSSQEFLRQRNWAEYGEEQKRLEAVLNEMDKGR